MMVNPKIWLHVSWITMVISIIIIVVVGPTWGIDFTGGSLLEVAGKPEDSGAVSSILQDNFQVTATVQTTQSGTFLIRTSSLTQEQVSSVTAELKEKKLITGEVLRFESVGPTIGAEIRQKSWLAIGLSLLLIIMYLAYTFRGARGLTSPWKFGLAAIYALLHDLLVVTALFVVLGKWKGVEIDTLFVTAQLAIFGYSVNDTIIIFDRLKSEWLTTRSADLTHLINKAIGDTLMRSLNTSLTILIVLLALLFFGGETIRWFIVALTAGTITGTYSSLYVAPPFLQYLAKRSWR